MRRAHTGIGSEPMPAPYMEEENDNLEASLHSKVKTLKSLTINIGTEVRSQNSLLKTMDDDFDTSSTFLSSTMGRLKKIASKGGCRYTLYLVLFCLFVFWICWMVIKFR